MNPVKVFAALLAIAAALLALVVAMRLDDEAVMMLAALVCGGAASVPVALALVVAGLRADPDADAAQQSTASNAGGDFSDGFFVGYLAGQGADLRPPTEQWEISKPTASSRALTRRNQ